MSDATPAAGWYPAPHADNELRYWDGMHWLEPEPAPANVTSDALPTAADVPGEAATPTEAEPSAKAKMPAKKKWIIGGLIAAGWSVEMLLA
ncbi:DUF2510 domain-containing protein [Microbacterium maritypicum]|uniref:DUF2510 domain-containing protein n=1 Tax=Microbacterium TaxID=33882 RepID=UPI001FBAA3F6|nr:MULTISPECIES: DUF2510 domain-containing protein [Microbacterium]